MRQLRPYQRAAVDSTLARWSAGAGSGLLVLPTGCGKTFTATSLLKERLFTDTGLEGRAFWLAHREELLVQALKSLSAGFPQASLSLVIGPQALKSLREETDEGDREMLERAYERRWDGDVVVASIQSIRAPFEKKVPEDVAVVVVDEAHHAVLKTRKREDRSVEVVGNTYGRLLTWMRARNPELKVVGLTATPYRADGRGLGGLFAETFDSQGLPTASMGRSFHTYTMLDAIKDGWLVPFWRDLETGSMSSVQVRTNTTLARSDGGAIHTRGGDFVAKELDEAINNDEQCRAFVEAWLERASDRPTIVFCLNVGDPAEGDGHVFRMTRHFRERGVVAEPVWGGMDRGRRKRAAQDFLAGKVKVLINCGIYTEGTDLPPVSCIAIARPTKSLGLYCFDADTEILTPRGWVRGMDLEGAGERVAAFDQETGAIEWQHTIGYVRRPVEEGEEMVSMTSPGIDFRVTDNHRVVWRHRVGRDRRRSEWKVSTAKEMLARRDVWELPVAGQQRAAGVELSDAELEFVAWVQTDGNVNWANGCIRIAQTSAVPERCRLIEDTLDACGFKWRISQDDKPTNFGPRSAPLNIYRVSKGKPRGEDKHLRGWGALERWIPKADTNAWRRLGAMDDRQFQVFLEAWHQGDGSKQTGQSWTRRSYHLAVSDKMVADWLQSMCIRRGWRCNVAKQTDLWMVHAKRSSARYVGGASAKDRPRLQASSSEPGEMVWCVQVKSGAVVVRRNGKATVLGNCQMVGRGTRPSPETGKRDLLVLDGAYATPKGGAALRCVADLTIDRPIDLETGLPIIDMTEEVGEPLPPDPDKVRKDEHGRLDWTAVAIPFIGADKTIWWGRIGRFRILDLGDRRVVLVMRDSGAWRSCVVDTEHREVVWLTNPFSAVDDEVTAVADAEDMIRRSNVHQRNIIKHKPGSWHSRQPLSENQWTWLVDRWGFGGAEGPMRKETWNLAKGQAAVSWGFAMEVLFEDRTGRRMDAEERRTLVLGAYLRQKAATRRAA